MFLISTILRINYIRLNSFTYENQSHNLYNILGIEFKMKKSPFYC